MKKVAILVVLALTLMVGSCGTGTPSTEVNLTTNGSWEAQINGGTGQASLLNFIVSFALFNTGPLDVTAFGFFNSGTCFSNIPNTQKAVGTATLTATATGAVTGTLTMTVTSTTTPPNVLTLTAVPPKGGLTGTSNGAVGVTGTLSNGVAVGQWTLTGPCVPTNQSGTFVMCQGTNKCTPP